MADNSLILNAKQAAELLGVSTVTLWKMRKRGIVKALENFHPPRYSRQHLNEITSNQPKP